MPYCIVVNGPRGPVTLQQVWKEQGPGVVPDPASVTTIDFSKRYEDDAHDFYYAAKVVPRVTKGEREIYHIGRIAETKTDVAPLYRLVWFVDRFLYYPADESGEVRVRTRAARCA